LPRADVPDLAGVTLLVIDDNNDSLDMLATFLRSCGSHVLQARGALSGRTVPAITLTGFPEQYMDPMA
jgi:hypothetical protein